jgi:hypothetical protein
MPMTTTTETKYKVQSLERGLVILRELCRADAPVRNQDLVNRTGLPKATVSRLLNTLGALGYVRRSDKGSYVLANASANSGRAMLSALRLDRYRALFDALPGPVYLEALVGLRWVPVYRWSGPCSRTVANGSPLPFAREASPDGHAQAELWDAQTATWWAWTCLQIDGVGAFALTLQSARECAPSPSEVSEARAVLQQAADALSCARTQ